jgi:hypothetical protein
MPVIGIGNWSGSDADDLLNVLKQGHKYMDMSYNQIVDEDELDTFTKFISEDCKDIQKYTLSKNCDYFVKRLTHKDRLTDPKVIIYCGMWAPLGIGEVVVRLKRLPPYINKNDVKEIHEFTREHLPSELEGTMFSESDIASRAETIYDYVTSL